jgi:hypothetical protein
MMMNLLYKEFKLSVHPTCYIFLSLAAMMLIPNYPYYVIFFYETLGLFFLFMAGNATNDIFFTTLLPIRKQDAVKARVITVVLIELLQVLVCIPFAILRHVLLKNPNLAGLEANAALFGFGLMMFGLFNVVFLPMFYKTAYKTGTPFVIACVVMTVFVIGVEATVNLVPGWKAMLDSINPVFLPQQIFVLGLGIAIFGLLTTSAYHLSVKRFAALDL